MGIGLFYALELLSLISINLLVTFLVIRSFKPPAPTHSNVATQMNTPNSKPSDSNLNLFLNVSSIESETLSESSLNDLTPDLISSGSTSESSSSSNTTTSPYGSNASEKCFRMSNANFQQDGSDSDSPYHTTFEDSASLNTPPPPIIISPPRQEQMNDGSTPSPSPITERIPGQRQRTSLAERLLSLVDSNGRPIRLVKRLALKDITNIAKPHSSVLVAAAGGDECNEDASCLVYRSAEEFLPTFVSTPPTFNAPYSESNGFFGSTSSSRFGDMFSPNASTPTFVLPESFKLSHLAGSMMTRITGDIVTSLAAKYQNEYSDDYEDDDGAVMGQQFEWEDEMRSLESTLGFYDKKM